MAKNESAMPTNACAIRIAESGTVVASRSAHASRQPAYAINAKTTNEAIVTGHAPSAPLMTATGNRIPSVNEYAPRSPGGANARRASAAQHAEPKNATEKRMSVHAAIRARGVMPVIGQAALADRGERCSPSY